MILLDTNVLVALAEPRDALNARAATDLRRLAGRPMMLTQGVLVEAFALVTGRPGRARLRAIIESLDPEPCVVESDRKFRLEVFNWIERYADHDPDFADAVLVILSGRFRNWKVWSYDREFSTIWRRPDGTMVPLAVSSFGK